MVQSTQYWAYTHRYGYQCVVGVVPFLYLTHANYKREKQSVSRDEHIKLVAHKYSRVILSLEKTYCDLLNANKHWRVYIM